MGGNEAMGNSNRGQLGIESLIQTTEEMGGLEISYIMLVNL